MLCVPFTTAAALLVVLLSLFMLFVLTEVQPLDSKLQACGVDIVLGCQQALPWAKVPMLTLSALGGAEVVIAISPILLFAVDREIGIRVLTLLVGSLYVSGLLKQALHAPRPTWVNGSVAAWVCEHDYGSPSGHSQNAVSLYIFAVWEIVPILSRRKHSQNSMHAACALYTIALLIISGVGISRVFLGAHFPHQVILGWLLGGTLVTAFCRVEHATSIRLWKNFIEPEGLIRTMCLCLLASLALLSLGVVEFLAVNSTWTFPSVWTHFIEASCPNTGINKYGTLQAIALAAGALPTIVFGEYVRHHHLKDWNLDCCSATRQHDLYQKGARTMVAVAATAGSYIGIGAMIPEHGNPYMVIVLRFWGRGVGAVVALLVLAPYICLQLKWLGNQADKGEIGEEPSDWRSDIELISSFSDPLMCEERDNFDATSFDLETEGDADLVRHGSHKRFQ
mmetsp:Transcript_13211/g.25252  ORF Transcript_13211/g.25252 Transcript_13211/m.25252 type:complete len:451 (+) Transcript_13211:227-1579(+)|eukprot:CAMPEP_0114231838 /NCGR_PEP_ID=MMETSP0058-20121206/4273_1 /TAXON_ID=36894 /ORGANISM="Pyramimonas parkeae, CCMP726" /LENGTH=450 /DNA_ID=CAMNT_0001343245 /DNA_START=171 /DNA_END=1523 /DNA_ORIENTATION=+